MGNKCLKTRGKAINPGSALDRVISQASSDDCVLYRLADYKKGTKISILIQIIYKYISKLQVFLINEKTTIFVIVCFKGNLNNQAFVL